MASLLWNTRVVIRSISQGWAYWRLLLLGWTSLDRRQSSSGKQTPLRNVRRPWRGAGESTPPEFVNTLPPSDAFIRTYVLNGPKYWYDPEYDCSALWAGVTPDMSLTTHLFGSLFAHYDLAQGPELTMPIFLGLGRYDYVVPYTLWEKRQKALPNLTSHLFEHSGHTPQFEEPTLFDQRLTAWLESLDKK